MSMLCNNPLMRLVGVLNLTLKCGRGAIVLARTRNDMALVGGPSTGIAVATTRGGRGAGGSCRRFAARIILMDRYNTAHKNLSLFGKYRQRQRGSTEGREKQQIRRRVIKVCA